VIQFREASYPRADKNPDPEAEWPQPAHSHGRHQHDSFLWLCQGTLPTNAPGVRILHGQH